MKFHHLSQKNIRNNSQCKCLSIFIHSLITPEGINLYFIKRKP